mmetsp:Transcript_5885/g.17669  ORF Transcript_5885/g.17669 Transcript_5885/m.17669 type:complete len:193 (+) Transcript_5885:279-857(+)
MALLRKSRRGNVKVGLGAVMLAVVMVTWVIVAGAMERRLNSAVTAEVSAGKERIDIDSMAAKYRSIGDWSLESLSELHHFLDWFAVFLLKGERAVEGHSGQVYQQVAMYFKTTAHFQPEVICEIGFNAGHSASTFLSAAPNATYYGFDSMDHSYTPNSYSFLSNVFPGRTSMVWGDSIKTVPEFQRTHPKTK